MTEAILRAELARRNADQYVAAVATASLSPLQRLHFHRTARKLNNLAALALGRAVVPTHTGTMNDRLLVAHWYYRAQAIFHFVAMRRVPMEMWHSSTIDTYSNYQTLLAWKLDRLSQMVAGHSTDYIAARRYWKDIDGYRKVTSDMYAQAAKAFSDHLAERK
jgi:hypothetical protein